MDTVAILTVSNCWGSGDRNTTSVIMLKQVCTFNIGDRVEVGGYVRKVTGMVSIGPRHIEVFF